MKCSKILLVKKVAWTTALNVEPILCRTLSCAKWVYISLNWRPLWPWPLIIITGLTSKSKLIRIIYTPIQMSVPNLRNLGQFCVYLSSEQGLVYINMLMVTVTLTFDRFDLKITMDHLHPEMHVCAKFAIPRLILYLVIIRTRFGLPKVKFKVTLWPWPWMDWSENR